MSPGDAPCPGCGRELAGPETSVVVDGPPTLVRCRRCRLVSLETMPSADAQAALYQDDYYEPEEGARFVGVLERLVSAFRWLRMRDVLRLEPGPASILDVGCGRGSMLELFQRRGWRVLGTQLSATAARAARELRGVDVVLGELPALELPAASFRVVTFFHVLEHLERPAVYLRHAHRLLEDDGLLLVEVPSFATPGFRLLGARNLCIDHPHHLVFFEPRTLREMLEREGFEVEATSYFSLEYSPITTLQNLLNALPGRPNRLLDALKRNPEGRRLLREPVTWMHFVGAGLLAPTAWLLSLLGLILPLGNTLRMVARKRSEITAPGGAASISRPSSSS